MSTELLINVTPSESRVALIENGVLQEIQLERIGNLGIVGNIYLGKISRVLPVMQADVDIEQVGAMSQHLPITDNHQWHVGHLLRQLQHQIRTNTGRVSAGDGDRRDHQRRIST